MSEETLTLSSEVQQIIDEVKQLSVLQLSELVKGLEETFGVTAAAPMMMGAMPMASAGGEAAVEEAPTSFDVILKDHGSQKIQVIKEVRALTGLGLKEAKDLVDGCPKPVKQAVADDEAKKIKETLEAVGAVIEIKPAG
ncbi:MAG TPA: 50S ribosomal protein L7/L12 [Candidatus Hydrogenedentes bacterium]|nr:50S ribosomal protein L7/L12 [Candidatus Hydrogenedentota bacterium]HNT86875.1 50S ribosomal protein L7/L12 [Candidatus Hydrogenedentota bacterium]